MTLPRLYAVADAAFGDPVELAGLLFRGGARLVQVRDKESGGRLLLDRARAVVRMAPPGVRVIVNDRLDVALLSGADGVHLGQDDVPVVDARRIAGPEFIIGLSTHTPGEVDQANAFPVDYIGFGPVFATRTKADHAGVVGCPGLASTVGRARHPVVAIGGIDLENLASVVATGVGSVAVVSALLRDGDIERRTAEFCEKLHGIGSV